MKPITRSFCMILIWSIPIFPLVAQAEIQDFFPEIPPEAVSPLGTLIVENPSLFDVSSLFGDPRVDISNASLSTQVAPGELLPISIKLSNFGGGARVDVLLHYGIFSDSGMEIYSLNETVAVETTASFIKTVQIPLTAHPGSYTARTSISYRGQVVPAATQFPFTVERKIFGLFQSEFILYGSITVIIAIIMLLSGYIIVRHRRKTRFTPFDYSAIPKNERTFYEILSDTIMQMRSRVGDDALVIASHIPGLSIDDDTGKIMKIEGRPAKIIAELVAEYEKLLGKKVSFTFREQSGSNVDDINKKII